jgi:hypothetical protein
MLRAQGLDVNYKCVGMADLKECSKKFVTATFPIQSGCCWWMTMQEASHACFLFECIGPFAKDSPGIESLSDEVNDDLCDAPLHDRGLVSSGGDGGRVRRAPLGSLSVKTPMQESKYGQDHRRRGDEEV